MNKKVSKLELAPVAECIKGTGKWIEGMNVAVDPDVAPEDQFYVIDLTSSDYGELYSRNLNYLKLRIQTERSDDRESNYAYITAYGFPFRRS